MTPPAPHPHAALLLEHAEFVRALARSLVRDPAGADDLEQETWLRALEHAPRDASNPRGWLATVVANLSRNRGRERERRTRRERAAARPERIDSSASAAEQSDTLRALVGAVVELEEPYRSTLLGLYFQGASVDELAARDSVTAATVRSRHARALAQLRQRLDRERGGREAWCGALASLTGIETGASSAGVAALVAAALLVVGLVGGRVWSLWRAQREPVKREQLAQSAATPRPELVVEAPAPASIESDGRRAEAPASEIVLRGHVLQALSDDEQPRFEPASDCELTLQLHEPMRGFGRVKVFADEKLRTDAEGRFEWRVDDPLARPLSYAAVVNSDAMHRTASSRGVLEDHGPRELELELRRVQHGEARVRVVTAEGDPLAGATVRMGQRNDPDAREELTNADGVARFSRVESVGDVALRLPGWITTSFEAPQKRASGGWSEGRLVAARAGSLRVRVTSSRGAALSGARVSLSPAPWESEATSSDMLAQPQTCDERGEASFEAVWPGIDLELRIEAGSQRLVAHQRDEAGRLLAEGAHGFALRVAPGDVRSVYATWGGALELELLLERADGAPLGDVELEALDLGRHRGDPNRKLASLHAREPSGPVRWAIDVFEFRGPLALFARELGDGVKPSGLARAGDGGARSTRAFARAQIARDLLQTHASDEPPRLELLLAPVTSLRGRLVDGDGRAVAHHRGAMGGVQLRVTPAGISSVLADDFLPEGVRAEYVGESEFQFHGLPPGRYELLASEQIDSFFTFDATTQRFEVTAPDDRELELRIERRASERVRVRLTTNAAPDATRGMIVLMAAWTPAQPIGPRESAAALQTVRGLAPWPAQVPRSFTGVSGARELDGSWTFGLDSAADAAQATLPELSPGWYVFGVHAGGLEGRGFAPSATQLAYYAAGEYEIAFELTEAADLRGVVRRNSNELTAIELVDERGVRVAFGRRERFGARTTTRLVVGSSGVVELLEVPLGRFKLRAGSPAQLERGAFARELELVLGPDPEPFELDLR